MEEKQNFPGASEKTWVKEQIDGKRQSSFFQRPCQFSWPERTQQGSGSSFYAPLCLSHGSRGTQSQQCSLACCVHPLLLGGHNEVCEICSSTWPAHSSQPKRRTKRHLSTLLVPGLGEGRLRLSVHRGWLVPLTPVRGGPCLASLQWV